MLAEEQTSSARPGVISRTSADDTIIAKAFWWSIAVVAGAGLLVGGFLILRGGGGEAPPDPIEKDSEPPKPLVTDDITFPMLPFENITTSAGIDFA